MAGQISILCLSSVRVDIML